MRNGNFGQGTCISKVFVGSREISFFCMRETLNLLLFGCFLLRDILLRSVFRSRVVTYLIDLLTRAYSRLTTGLSSLWSTLEKVSQSSFFLSYLIACVVTNRSTQRVGRQALRTFYFK